MIDRRAALDYSAMINANVIIIYQVEDILGTLFGWWSIATKYPALKAN